MKHYIRYYGDPILRKDTQPIKKITGEIKSLVQEMGEIMQSLKGAGIAAPQVGESLRLFIIRPVISKSKVIFDKVKRYITEEGHPLAYGEPMVFINPVLSNPSEKKEPMTEGCLSFPGVNFEFERPVKIHVEALDLDGKKFELDATGFLARQIMHEYDHTRGKLIIDYVEDSEMSEVTKSTLDTIKNMTKKA